jgi:hypothetical protein
MATVIQFKRSSTQNSVPATSDLSLGELAVTLITVDSTLKKMTVQLPL